MVDKRQGAKSVAVLVGGNGGCVIATRVVAAAEASTATIGILPRPSTSNHSRGSSLISCSNGGQGLGGGPFSSYRSQDGPRGERAHLSPTNLLAQHK